MAIGQHEVAGVRARLGNLPGPRPASHPARARIAVPLADLYVDERWAPEASGTTRPPAPQSGHLSCFRRVRQRADEDGVPDPLESGRDDVSVEVGEHADVAVLARSEHPIVMSVGTKNPARCGSIA